MPAVARGVAGRGGGLEWTVEQAQSGSRASGASWREGDEEGRTRLGAAASSRSSSLSLSATTAHSHARAPPTPRAHPGMQFPKAKRFTDKRALLPLSSSLPPFPPLSSPSLNPRSRWPPSHRSTRLDPATGSLRRPRPLAPAELQARSHDGPRFPLRRPARPQQARSVPPSPSPASSPMDRRAHSRCPHRHVRPVRRGPARPRQGERQTSRPHHLDHRQPGRPRAPQSPGASCSSHSSSRPVSPSGHR